MKPSILFIFIYSYLFSIFPSYAQDERWYAYTIESENEDFSEIKIGYQDSLGNIKIPPVFGFFTIAEKFDHIIAVSEYKEGKRETYHLLKDGTIIGRDSMYVFDMAFTCEQEGFIRFEDQKTQRMGLFNRKGEVVIPAKYRLLPVYNGLVVALKDPEKVYWGNEGDVDYEVYYSWEGSSTLLIDTAHNILVEDFNENLFLDYHSLQIEDIPSTDPARVSIQGMNGKYYTFIDHEVFFKEKFLPEFLSDLSPERILKYTYPEITFAYPDRSRETISASEALKKHHLVLQKRFSELEKPETDYFISWKRYLSEYTGKEKEMEKYYNNCLELQYHRYPVFEIVHMYQDIQSVYTFFKTEDGFKLIQVTLR